MKFFSFLMFALLATVPACSAQGLDADKTWTDNSRFKGTDPWANINAFGARSVLTPPSAKVSCNGTTVITINSIISGLFQNGDGITIYGCGSKNTLLTPGAPTTVAPSNAAGMTGTGQVVRSAQGDVDYCYKIVARTKEGGLTAAGTETCLTATGQASLGLQTVSVTSAALSNDTIKLTMSGTTNIVAGTLIHYRGSSNAQFSGFFTVSSVSRGGATVEISNTGYDSRAQGWQPTDTVFAAGGTVDFFQCNHVIWTAVPNAWEYYIYANRNDGGYALIGVTKPSGNNGWRDVSYDDFGQTFTANQSFPSYVPLETPPSVKTNNPLTTTIVSGAGGGSLVVAKAATQTIPMQTAVFDDAPAILAAANSINGNKPGFTGGTVYIPPSPFSGGLVTTFVINSYLPLPAYTKFLQAGRLKLNETIEIPGEFNWSGEASETGVPQFGFAGYATITMGTANPAIYVPGSANIFDHLGFTTNVTNGGTFMVVDGPYQSFDYVNFQSGAANNDYLSMSVMFRDTTGTIDSSYFHKTFFGGQIGSAPSDSTWTPLVYYAEGQNGIGSPQQTDYLQTFEECFFNWRGVVEINFGGALFFKADWTYRQSGVMPMFTFQSLTGSLGGNITLHTANQDTDVEPLLFAENTTRGTIAAQIDIDAAIGPSQETGGTPPLVSGQRLLGLNVTALASEAEVPQNRDSIINKCYNFVQIPPYLLSGGATLGSGCVEHVLETINMGSDQNIYWPMNVPGSVSASASGVGTWTAGTYFIAVTSVDPSGGETVLSTPSSAAVNGLQGIQTTWTNPLGSSSTNGYWCQGTCTATVGTWRQFFLHRPGKSFTAASKSSIGQNPNVTTAGQSLMNATGVYAPLAGLPEKTAPSGVTGFDLIYGDSTAHDLKRISNNGTSDILGDAIVEYCGATSGGTQNCAKTRELNPIIIFGEVTLNTATSQFITALPFTSSSSYSCSGSDLTTSAGIVSFNIYAAASVTIHESGGANTDHLRYQCVGY